MAEIQRLLSGFLSEAMRRQWRWGECDCLLWLADWVKLRTGLETADEYRNRYTTQREARRLIQAAGGIVSIVERCAVRAGASSTDVAIAGDIGLVRVAWRPWRQRMIYVPMGAICVRPDLWAVKPADGRQMQMQTFPVLQAWTFEDG